MPSYSPPKQLEEPQDSVDSFWQTFNSKKPGHVRRILRLDRNGTSQDPARIEGKTLACRTDGSYDEARKACIARVQTIVRECKRQNRKFQDPDFDIYDDFRYTLCKDSDCLHGLPQHKIPELGPLPPPPPPALPFDFAQSREERSSLETPYRKGRVATPDTTKHPRAVHRCSEIFENPLLTPNAPRSHLATVSDRRQRVRLFIKRQIEKTAEFLELHTGILSIYRPFPGRLPAVPQWLSSSTKLFFRALHILYNRWSFLLRAYLWIATTAIICGRFVNLLRIRTSLIWLLSNTCVAFLLRLWTVIDTRASRLHFSAAEIRQSDNLGNCWWLSAVATLSNRDQLLRRLFVAWDQDCGVYGFCFFRDGSWMYTVVDDYLYLTSPDFLGSGDHPPDDKTGRRYQAWKTGFQRGSDALFFGKCQDANQTWLPLLEKAYSKIHGDYDAVHGGCPSEAVEDLTGGVSSPLPPSSVLNKDSLWKEMLGAGKDHVYSLNAPATGASSKMRGITLMHAFSVDKAFWYFDINQLKWIRLLEIRNPWGVRDGLWEGAWGSCSKEWSLLSTWFLKTNPQQDGVFFMTYEDAIGTFDSIERTRLLDERDWFVRKSWVKMDVTWTTQYNPVYFTVHITKPTEVVFALSQLEDRYFLGLVGRYVFHLTVLIRKRNAEDGEYIAFETAGDEVNSCARRSVTVEKFLEAGEYEVLVKINALTRGTDNDNVWSVEDTLRQSMNRPKKLQQIARNYDEAFSKLKTVRPSGRISNSLRSCASSDTDSDCGTEVFDPVKSTTKMIPKPEDAAWNAVCGVGLRVFSKDSDLYIDLNHRQKLHWTSCTSGSISGIFTPPTDTTSEASSDAGSDDEWHDVENWVDKSADTVAEVAKGEPDKAQKKDTTQLAEEDDAEELVLRKLGWIGS